MLPRPSLFLHFLLAPPHPIYVYSVTNTTIPAGLIFKPYPLTFPGLPMSFSSIRTLLIFLCVSMTVPAQDFILRGVLLDSVFARSDSVSAQLLESGESFTVRYGEPFEISLPPDDFWNLCIRDDNIEQCYVIEKKGGGDTVFVDSLDNENQLSVFSAFVVADTTVDTATAVVDTTVSSAEDSIPQEQVELLTRLRPVVIQVRKRPRRSLGQSTVSSKAIARQPGLAEADVIKAIQALPGVVASSDFSSKIYVRGGGADQNLFLFDNGVVYSPVHFFGLFSTFLVDGIDKVDFYKGGFSPSYGNRLSSVVDIRSRKGGREDNDTLQLKGSAQITTFATTVSAEGSKGATRINLSGRSTYIKEVLGLLRSAGVTDLDIDYRFYDLQGNIFQGLGDDMGLQLSAYNGRDRLLFTPLETFWGNTVIPLNWYWRPSDDLTLRSSLSYSAFEQEFGIENLQTFINEIQSVSFKPWAEYTGWENHVLLLGLESQSFLTLFGNRADFINLDITAENTFWLHSFFAEDRISLGRFELMPGLRANYLSSLETVSAEPRLSVSWTFTENQRLDAHAGYYKQFINSVIFGDFESLNEFYYPATKEKTQVVPPASSVLFSLGYSQDALMDMLDFTWEVYYKTLDDLIVFAPNSKPDSIRNDPNVSLGDLFIQGEGYSLGAEISLRKTEGLFTGGASYAFGYSVQKEAERVFFAKWDIPHSVKIDGGITWRNPEGTSVWRSPKNYLRSSFQIKYTTGLPYTEITGYLPTHYLDQGEGQLPGGPSPGLANNIATPLGGRNRSRYPAYSRVDAKLIDWGRKDRWNFSWTLLNIFNRENVFLYVYDNTANPPERNTIPQFPFFPVLFAYKQYF